MRKWRKSHRFSSRRSSLQLVRTGLQKALNPFYLEYRLVTISYTIFMQLSTQLLKSLYNYHPHLLRNRRPLNFWMTMSQCVLKVYEQRRYCPHGVHLCSGMAMRLSLILSRPRWIDTTVSILTWFLEQNFFLNEL